MPDPISIHALVSHPDGRRVLADRSVDGMRLPAAQVVADSMGDIIAAFRERLGPDAVLLRQASGRDESLVFGFEAPAATIGTWVVPGELSDPSHRALADEALAPHPMRPAW